MSLPASDNFDRANESPLGGNWTAPDGQADSKFLLVGDGSHGHLEGQGGATIQWMYWNADSFNTNHKSQIVLSGGNDITNSGNYCGVSVRIQSSGQSGYYWGIITGAYKLRRLDSGTQSSDLATIADTPTVNDVLRLEASGTTITGFLNGTQKVQVTDNTYSNGAPGLFGYRGTDAWELDTWAGDNLSAGGPAMAARPAFMLRGVQ